MAVRDTLAPTLRHLYRRLPLRGKVERRFEEGMVQELLGLYSQEHRRYHDLQHLQECMEEFNEVSTMCDDPLAAETAMWYHDVVYDPGEKTNERLSANKAKFDCMRLMVEPEFADKVCAIILTTAAGVAHGPDASVVVDIDRSILGRPWERFSEYERQIREEYSRYTDEEYKAGRTLFLDAMLRREHIFLTNRFREKYEGAAKANIARSLMNLRQ